MSSAEDMIPLTTTPPASPSELQPEEFPIELEEVEAPQLSPKPTIKTNTVAQAVWVKATGAHPGLSAGERELFTEETSSVLVFENCGVIRLSAAVAPGQLLFLTKVESMRDVVTQVKRKRTYRPTSCYVELEFAEPVPRLWGMEFSAVAALLPKDAQEAEAAALAISAEATADEPGEPPPAPTAEEVQALKREVETLREQLKLMQTPAASKQAPALSPVRTAVSDASPPPVVGCAEYGIKLEQWIGRGAGSCLHREIPADGTRSCSGAIDNSATSAAAKAFAGLYYVTAEGQAIAAGEREFHARL